jgi:hypothetical protein
MLVRFDLLSEGVGVSIHQGKDCVVAFLAVGVEVVATDTVAAFAGLVQPEAVAVQFQAFCFFAVAEHFFA